MPTINENDLIIAAQKQDLDAFNKLVLFYQEQAFNLAFRILVDEDAAEDATQTAFISAFRKLSTYRGGSFKAWVLRMVVNACYDELRRIKRHPNIPLEPLDADTEEEIESPAWLEDDNPSPEEMLDQAELEHALTHCLENLPVEFRTVVVLVDVQGCDYQEVSHVIGKPLGTIKSRLARARLKLQTCLQGFGELLPARFRLEGEGNQ